MISAGWLLGIFFFIFIFAALAFILATKTSLPPVKPASIAKAEPQPTSGANVIRRNYRIEISPQVFVNYPFGLRVVFTTSTAESKIGNVRRNFEDSDYSRWAQADQDPHLIVQHGQIEFEAEEPEPAIRAEIKFDADAFESTQAVAENILCQDQETVYSLWLNPLKAQTTTATVMFALVRQSKQRQDELTSIPLSISIEHFPIRLR